MKISKFKLVTCVSAIALSCLCISFNSKSVEADTLKNDQTVVVKSVNVGSKKVIVVPAKKAATSNSNKNNNTSYSRGTSSNAGSGAGYSKGDSVVAFAYAQIGKPYVWGAAGPNSFDCSGLVMYVYSKFGISLPHSSQSQFGMGQAVSKDNLKAGDLVFFNTYTSIGHVGIYVGNGNFIHAPNSGSTVTVSNLNEGYYAANYAGARRVK